MTQEPFSSSLERMKSVQLPNGGFPYHKGERAQPDATAWAIIALSAYAFDSECCDRGRAYLISQQTNDGRISISPTHPEASWPTPLAILAWQGSPPSHEAQSRAADYLIGLTGQHFPNPDTSITGHDTAILGWPWIVDTHSWVIPTGLAIMALQQMGWATHNRVVEGQHMLIDRQLPHGGWNYGNTFVFGKELHPLPESTGVALQVLADTTPKPEVEQSLDYLLHELSHLRTPLSLSWALMGLGAWGLKPANTKDLAVASLQRQEKYGPYPIPSLALLLCAVKASQGFHSLFRPSPREIHSPSIFTTE